MSTAPRTPINTNCRGVTARFFSLGMLAMACASIPCRRLRFRGPGEVEIEDQRHARRIALRAAGVDLQLRDAGQPIQPGEPIEEPAKAAVRAVARYLDL